MRGAQDDEVAEARRGEVAVGGVREQARERERADAAGDRDDVGEVADQEGERGFAGLEGIVLAQIAQAQAGMALAGQEDIVHEL